MEIVYHKDVTLYFVEGDGNNEDGLHVGSFQSGHLQDLSLYLYNSLYAFKG